MKKVKWIHFCTLKKLMVLIFCSKNFGFYNTFYSFWHTCDQNLNGPVRNIGPLSLHRKNFILCNGQRKALTSIHKFLIGLRSGLYAGHCIVWNFCAESQSFTIFAVCILKSVDGFIFVRKEGFFLAKLTSLCSFTLTQ